MRAFEAAEIIHRATELLWVIAQCDVENLTGHRSIVLQRLSELELRAAAMNISDLYFEVVQSGSRVRGA
jgi:hypothetical protein